MKNQNTIQQGLVFVAHGSRHLESNEHIFLLTKQLQSLKKNSYAYVNAAFLEFAHPNLPEAIEQQIEHRISQVTVFPYFLSAGAHVTQDIPAIIHSLSEKYPTVTFKLLSHLGAHPDILAFISQCV
jgi:sirohydrochlorin ferrochelatase